jgi:hypothetical protein
MWGTVLFYPVSTFLGGERYVAIANEGVMWAGNMIPWSAIGHIQFDQEHNIIRLWSSTSPGMIVFIFAPPAGDILKIVGFLQSHIADENLITPLPFLRRYTFPLAMTVGCISILAIAFVFLQLPSEVALITNSILMFALMLLGGPALLRSLFGKKIKPAMME